MSGELDRLECQVRHLKASMFHLDATLRLIDRDPNEIPSKRPYVRTKLFGTGKLNRLIMDALRRGARPMTTGEVVDGIVAELGYGDDAASGLWNRVRANLRYLEVKGTVAKEGTGPGAIWSLR